NPSDRSALVLARRPAHLASLRSLLRDAPLAVVAPATPRHRKNPRSAKPRPRRAMSLPLTEAATQNLSARRRSVEFPKRPSSLEMFRPTGLRPRRRPLAPIFQSSCRRQEAIQTAFVSAGIFR